MGSPIDWRPNYAIQAYRVSSTAPSPYYHRDCVGCNYSAQGDVTGVSFTTLDPDRTLCLECEAAL